MAPVMAFAIMAIPIWLTKYFFKNPLYFKIAGFGVGYYLFNIMFVLQLVSVVQLLWPIGILMLPISVWFSWWSTSLTK
jgi:hypothetical protein